MARQRGLTVAVTGANGYVGSRLIEQLASDDSVERILAFDIAPARGPAHPKVVADVMDVRDPALESRFAGVDIVVHLAFIMDPIKDDTEMRDVNVNGSQNVFRCAAKAGVGRVVYTSSATAYGAHPDNDMPLTEESPLRANLDFIYPAHKLEVEYVVREVKDEYPDLRFLIFRPAIVFGPNVDNAWSHMLELPTLISVKGYTPPMQFVHEDDVASALAFGVLNDLEGAYNLSPRDWLEWDQMVSMVGKRQIELPEPVAFSTVERMWGVGLAEAPAGILHYLMHPWVMSPTKLEEAGFRCRHSSYAAFSETLETTREAVRFGKARVERSDLRKGLLAGVGLLAGLVAFRTARSRG